MEAVAGTLPISTHSLKILYAELCAISPGLYPLLLVVVASYLTVIAVLFPFLSHLTLVNSHQSREPLVWQPPFSLYRLTLIENGPFVAFSSSTLRFDKSFDYQYCRTVRRRGLITRRDG